MSKADELALRISVRIAIASVVAIVAIEAIYMVGWWLKRGG